jgi:peptidoglycan/xylan/chitin deacetylase (PgdA/CDA1 family)
MVDEIEMENVLLQSVDGRTERTFAYPCGDTEADNKSYVSKVKKDFVGARGVQGKMQTIDEIDLFDIGSYMINGESGDSLISLVKKAINNNALLVFLFHGVGGGHNINVSVEAHSKLLHFLRQNEKDIWIAPLADIAAHIRKYQQHNSKD